MGIKKCDVELDKKREQVAGFRWGKISLSDEEAGYCACIQVSVNAKGDRELCAGEKYTCAKRNASKGKKTPRDVGAKGLGVTHTGGERGKNLIVP